MTTIGFTRNVINVFFWLVQTIGKFMTILVSLGCFTHTIGFTTPSKRWRLQRCLPGMPCNSEPRDQRGLAGSPKVLRGRQPHVINIYVYIYIYMTSLSIAFRNQCHDNVMRNAFDIIFTYE